MKILVVDDSSLMRKVTTEELESGGYQVLTCESGELALELVQKESIDLLILDIEMPILNGFETLKKLKTFYNNELPFPVVFFTASDKITDREEGFNLGATDFLYKKFDDGELLKRINLILKPVHRFKGCHVIAIDDSAVCRKVVADTFSEAGIHCYAVETEQEAMEIYHREGNIDLIITDKEMPNYNCVDFISKFRKINTQIPIVVLTADPKRDQILEFYQAGANDYMIKPFFKEEFVSRVYSLIDSYYMQKSLQGDIQSLEEICSLKDKFLSVCSHDLRTPIHGIIGLSDIILEDKTLEESEKEEIIQQIQHSANFLNELIKNLLDLRKLEVKEEYKLETYDLTSILKNSYDLFLPLGHTKNISFNLQNLPEKAPVECNEMAMTRAFNNILSNAIKFTPLNGSIDISYETDERFHILAFKDSGVGIPQDKLEDIMKNHTMYSTQGTNGEEGTGLGVSIVKSIIIKNNGLVELKSTVGEGTTFIVKLPK